MKLAVSAAGAGIWPLSKLMMQVIRRQQIRSLSLLYKYTGDRRHGISNTIKTATNHGRIAIYISAGIAGETASYPRRGSLTKMHRLYFYYCNTSPSVKH
jgi:hypothetical protein